MARTQSENYADIRREILRRSGADAVMVGRGAQGRPWHPAVLAAVGGVLVLSWVLRLAGLV